MGNMKNWTIIWVGALLVGSLVRAQTQEEIDKVVDNIREHQGQVRQIIERMRNEDKHQPYERIKKLTDDHGHRLTGSQALEDAIDDLHGALLQEGFDHVEKQEVTVPDLRRGTERARLVAPREIDMDILGLGFTVGTNGTIRAEAIVVKSYEELNEQAASGNTSGKIVVFNQEWNEYHNTVTYRVNGAVAAANAGAVAVLIKSVTDYSLYLPHTGTQSYNASITQIPTACLTIEDVEMLQRYQDRDDTIEIELDMEDFYHGNTTSYNVIAEIEGTEKPGEYVIFGGHIDSWDVGTGVMDDGGGVVISWQVLSLIKQLDFKPKRTMRFVAWTAEETTADGAWAFFYRYLPDINQTSLIMESDYGTFKPTGIRFTGSEVATHYLQAVVDLTEELGTDRIFPDGSQVDIAMWIDAGVPGAALGNANENYWWYHHTKDIGKRSRPGGPDPNIRPCPASTVDHLADHVTGGILADTLTMQDPDDLDECAMLWAATAYVVANMDEMLPRDGALPPTEPPAGRSTMMATANCFLLIGVYIFHAIVM